MSSEIMIEFIKQMGQALRLMEDALEIVLFKYESNMEDKVSGEYQGGTIWHREKTE